MLGVEDCHSGAKAATPRAHEFGSLRARWRRDGKNSTEERFTRRGSGAAAFARFGAGAANLTRKNDQLWKRRGGRLRHVRRRCGGFSAQARWVSSSRTSTSRPKSESWSARMPPPKGRARRLSPPPTVNDRDHGWWLRLGAAAACSGVIIIPFSIRPRGRQPPLPWGASASRSGNQPVRSITSSGGAASRLTAMIAPCSTPSTRAFRDRSTADGWQVHAGPPGPESLSPGPAASSWSSWARYCCGVIGLPGVQ